MRPKYLFYTGKALINSIVFNKKIPLAVSLIITNRCNYNCTYCYRWRKNNSELTTTEVLHLLSELKKLGTRFLQITGGEPFLRNDLLEIVQRAKEFGFYLGLNTNGSLIKDSKNVLKYIDKITFSLDGPAEIHERIRPQGSFKIAEEAIGIAKQYNLGVGIHVILTKYNIGCIDFLINFAKAKKITISFQPADFFMLSSFKKNPIVATREEIEDAFKKIENFKRKNKYIANNFLNLQYMKMWPEKQNIDCAGGRLFYRIESNGDVMICGMRNNETERCSNILSQGVRKALHTVKIADCNSCYNATRLSINLLYSILKLNKNVFFNFSKKIISFL